MAQARILPAPPLHPPQIPAVVINLDRHAEQLSWFMDNAVRIGLGVELRSADQ